MPGHCCVPLCRQRGSYDSDGNKVSFHGFPRNPEHRTRWTTAIKRKEGPEFIITSNTKVCSKHFNACDYLPHVVSGRHILRETAVPSVFPLTLTKKEKKPRKKQGLLAILMENCQAESHPRLQQHEAEVSGRGGVACIRDMVLPEEDWETPSGQEATKGPLSTNGEEPPEPAVLLPRIVSIMSLSSGTEASEDIATMNNDQRTPDEGTQSPPTSPNKAAGRCYECSLCSRRFANFSSARKHSNLHKDKAPHACTICGQTFTRSANLFKHQRIHTGEMRYACRECPSRFRKKVSLDRHKLLHAGGVELFHCDECGKAYQCQRSLRRHIEWHSTEKPYNCHLCPAAFALKSCLDAHALKHMPEREHSCPECHKCFVSRNNLAMHMRWLHEGPKAAQMSADTSPGTTLDSLDLEGKAPSEPASLRPRIIIIGPRKSSNKTSKGTKDANTGASDGSAGSPMKKRAGYVGTYECGVCGRRFTERWSLKDHQLSHTEEKKHACPVCGRKFALKAAITRHLHVHASELRYACPHCPSRFCKKASLDAHKQLHLSGVELFYCHECNKNFQQMNALQRHLKWHKKRKSYLCHLCPAAFPYRSALASHRLVHTGERPHVCPVCQRGFTWKNNLKAHMRLLHYGVKTAVQSAADSGLEITMPSSPLSMLPPVVTSVNIKEEPRSPPSSSSPVVTSVNIKEEPRSPPSSPSPVVTSVNIKEEPRSPPSSPSPVVTSVNIEEEPRSPPSSPSPVVMSVNIKEEPRSPPSSPSPVAMSVNIKEVPRSPPSSPSPNNGGR